MNIEELSMIGPEVDLETVDAINRKRLLAFVNNFIINTSLFLNKLSNSCENGLMSLENKIQKLEASILILESKLNSVPGLEDKKVLEPEVIQVSLDVPKVEINEKNDDEIQDNKEESSVESLDPAFMKYIKMLQFGVPPPAVKLKMEQEGVDSSLHETILNYNK